MISPQAFRTYEVELCSGERRHWTCLGPDARDNQWWRDVETGFEFSEAALMYVWTIIREHPEDHQRDDGPPS